jgi:hypothetical protein
LTTFPEKEGGSTVGIKISYLNVLLSPGFSFKSETTMEGGVLKMGFV